MPWYAVRTVYAFGVKDDGLNVYEERIVAFEAPTWEHALGKARDEADTYALEQDFEAHPEQGIYEQDGSPLVDGYELWSQLFETKLELDAFYDSRYRTYDYHPPR